MKNQKFRVGDIVKCKKKQLPSCGVYKGSYYIVSYCFSGKLIINNSPYVFKSKDFKLAK